MMENKRLRLVRRAGAGLATLGSRRSCLTVADLVQHTGCTGRTMRELIDDLRSKALAVTAAILADKREHAVNHIQVCAFRYMLTRATC